MPKRSLVLLIMLLVAGWTVAAWLYFGTAKPAFPPTVAPIAAEPARETEFERIFREWAAKPELAGALVGFCLLDERGDALFASPLAGTALCPASALKTITTGAALGILGPDFRFETILAGTAPLNAAGAIDGDLVLIGGGDPTLSRNDLVQLAKDAVAAGLKSVAGRLLVDATIFPANPLSDHWNWGDIGNGYGAGAFGLNLDRNRLAVRFDPGPEMGTPAKFLGAPAPRDTRWENYVVTGPAGSGDQVVVYSAPYSRTITLRGSVPAGESGFTVSGANPDPPALAVELLRAQLESAGVKFAGRTVAAGERLPLSRHQSVPLAEIIAHLHRVSDNLEAQCLFLTLGQKQSTDPADAVREFWEKAGVEFVGLRLLDGSGLARASMIRPLDLARVNFAARAGPHGARFFSSLSSSAEGKVRSKNGAMSGVRSEVGFVRTADDRELTFALIANGLRPGIDFWSLRGELLEAMQAAAPR